MDVALSTASPPSLLVALLMIVSGGLLYAAPLRRYRTLGHAGLALGWALAAGRYLGVGAGLAVATVGLLLTWLLDVGEDTGDEPLGVPMRLLLALFAAIAAAALVVGRPLGAATALDANAAWYWSGALGLLLLMSGRGDRSTARGGALVIAAAGLAVLHLAPGPPIALSLACALLMLALGATVRGLAVPRELFVERAGLAVDALLAAGLLGLTAGLAGRALPFGETTFGLGPTELSVALAAVALGAGLAAHARLVAPPGAAGVSSGALVGAFIAVLALAAGSPPVAGVVAAMVPVAVVALSQQGRSTPAVLVVAAAAGTCAAALALVELSQASEPQPGLARVGLALALVHAGLLGAIAPAHLWALGVSRREPAAERDAPTEPVLAVVLGLGSLASLGVIVGAAQRYEWLLAVTGARPLLAGVAVCGIVLAGAALLAEDSIVRLVLQLGALAGAVALLPLASADPNGLPAGAAMLADRGVALALALVGADALARWRSGRATSPGRRLLRLDALPLWVGLAGLVGLPTGARLDGLLAAAADRPDLAALALAAAVVGLIGLKRVADAVVADASEAKEPDERPPAWRRLVPPVLSVLYLVSWLS